MKKKLTILTGAVLLGIGITTSAKATSIDTNLIHNSYVYSETGKRLNKKTLKKNSKVTILATKTIKNKKYVKIAKDQYVKAANVAMPTKRVLTHNAYVYNSKGKRIKKIVLKKNSKINTFELVTINKKKFYRIGKDQYVKVSNFKAANLITSDNKIEKTLKHTAALYDADGKLIPGDYAQEGTTWEIKSTKVIHGEKYYQTANGYIKAVMFEDVKENTNTQASATDFEKLTKAIAATSLSSNELQEKYHAANDEVRHDYDQALATAKKISADKTATVQDVEVAINDLYVAFNAINGIEL